MSYTTKLIGGATVVELSGGTAVPTDRHITPLAFVQRFTDAEAVAIDLASIGATQEAAAIRRYLQKVSLASSIDLDGDNVRNGLPVLEANGLLAPGRAAEIMNAPVQDHERP